MSQENESTQYYSCPAEEVLTQLHSGSAGLSEEEAKARVSQYGANRLPTAPARHPLLRFLSHFNNVLIYVLVGCAVVTAVLGHLLDSGVILAVVLANAAIGYFQEGRAEQAMNAIRRMLAPQTSVLRDGKRQRIDSVEVVPGDIVYLEAGERVPADLRLLQAKGMRVEEAILTGESVPVEKNTAAVPPGASLGDQSSMAFSGTLVAAGAGRGIVVATGSSTEIGKISGMLAGVQVLQTPLVTQMNSFSRWLTILILLVASVLLIYGYFVGHASFIDLFMAVVGLSVAAIPEGLPAVLTITLAIGVQAMASRNAIVRRLPAIETLGAVSVVCSDKTGTLTRNEMVVATVVDNSQHYLVKGEGYEPEGAVCLGDEPLSRKSLTNPVLNIAQVASLCNDAALHFDKGSWHIDGDPMEGALRALVPKIIADGDDGFSDWIRTDSIPFDSEHRYMAVLNHDHDGNARVSVKGAPEQVLQMCANQMGIDGQVQALDKDYWHEQIEYVASQGQRVIALASKDVVREHVVLSGADIDGKLTLLGLVGLIDPPRPEAIAAVAECKTAGVRVKMITGDHAGTAQAIGRQIGLQNPETVLTGSDLDSMDDASLAAKVIDSDIFARTSPAHKLRLVMALQSHGLAVAMTGDGVNDAPALKRADAGIAMGLKGSEAAKEASELVLADDNFASIVAAIREGRTVYDNIKKVISWTLPTNAGESLTIVFALLLGMALPVTAIQILWINLITAVTLGLALAFEPTEANTMRRPPRSRNAPLLDGQLIWHIVLVSILFVFGVFGIYRYAIDMGYSENLARTMALNTLVVLEIFHLFFIRNIYGTSLTWKAIRGTPVIWATVLAITLAQFAVTYLPTLQSVFGTEAVALREGFLIVGLGVLFFAIIEVEKQIRLVMQRPRKP